MNKTLWNLIKKYIDAKIQEEFAGRERDEEGYTGNPVDERKKVEEIDKYITNYLSP